MTHDERVHYHMYDTCEGIAEHAERIVALEELVRDMYGYAANREMELCSACVESDGEFADCAACDEYDGACGIAKKRFEELYADRVHDLEIEGLKEDSE